MKLLLQTSEVGVNIIRGRHMESVSMLAKQFFDTPKFVGKYLETGEMFLPGVFEAFLPVFCALLKLAPEPHPHPRPRAR